MDQIMRTSKIFGWAKKTFIQNFSQGSKSMIPGVERLPLEKITVVTFCYSKRIQILDTCHLIEICFIWTDFFRNSVHLDQILNPIACA